MIAAHIAIDAADIVTLNDEQGRILTICGKIVSAPDPRAFGRLRWKFQARDSKEEQFATYEMSNAGARKTTIAHLEQCATLLGIHLEG